MRRTCWWLGPPLAAALLGCGHDPAGGRTDGGAPDSGAADALAPDGCAHACDPLDETRCAGSVLEACLAGGNGCRSWTLVSDCGSLGQRCDDLGAPAACGGLVCDEPQGRGLALDGVADHVTMGNASGLGLGAFTLEAWIRWAGGGEAAGSGVGGTQAIPIVAKGRGESDGSNVDCNYFFGIHPLRHTLAADFEDMASGANHPILGQTVLEPEVWYHVAATYDGAAWRLYVNGELDHELTVDAEPRHDSVQHFALGAALDSAGARAGAFEGTLDEVRVWSRALTEAELLAGLSTTAPAGPGLVARWALDETTGAVASDAGGAYPGAVVGGSWVAPGAPLARIWPPEAAQLVAPADGALMGDATAVLSVWVDGRGDEPVDVTFWGREVGEDFAVVVLPDTQYYSETYHATFVDQTTWIVANRERYNIRAVLHAGDITDNGDAAPEQWVYADAAMSVLETPLPGFPEGIPYGLAVGNHDELPNGDPTGTTIYFNLTFGFDRFQGRSYYGGRQGTANNNNHFITFEAGPSRLLALFMAYDPAPDAAVIQWARDVIEAHPDRRVILTAHSLIGTGDPATFSAQGLATYDAFKDLPTFDWMICGHIHGEGQRADMFAGHTTYTLLADYQSWDGGGSGYLRLMEFSPRRQTLHVRTYSPLLDQWIDDADSDFVLPYAPQAPDFAVLGRHTLPGPGTQATHAWAGLTPDASFQWTATVANCLYERAAPTWSFRLAGGD